MVDLVNERMFVVDINAYWAALGEFVSSFASVEKNVLRALWHFSGVTPPIAPAVFSGTRIDTAMSPIKRVAEAQEWTEERKTQLEYVSAQLGEINRVRNDILHYGATFIDSDELVVSTELVAHVKERIRTTKMSVDILRKMTSDLSKIEVHLTELAWPHRHVPAARKRYDAILRSAWLYKPERQPAAPSKNPKRPR